MDKFFDIIAVVFPVAFVFCLGIASRRFKILSDKEIDGIKKIVTNFCLPAVIFAAFYKLDFSFKFLFIALIMIVVNIISLSIGFFTSKKFNFSSPLAPFLYAGFEAGMLGYGLYEILFGIDNIYNFALIDLGQVIFVFSIYMAILNMKTGVDAKKTLMDMIKNPVFIAIVVGVLFGVSGLGAFIDKSAAGGSVSELLNYVSAPTGMLMIFVVGYNLKFDRKSMKDAIILSITRLMMMSVLCFACILLIGNFVDMTDEIFWALILMFSLPAPFVLPIFADKEDNLISVNLSIYSLLSILIFAIISIISLR